MSFLFYLSIFYLLGIILWVTRKYDLFTISLIFGISAVFLGFGGLSSFLYLIFFFAVAEGITSILNKKHGKRSYVNLLGNCLAGSALIAFGQIYAGLASISAAFCDTASSEIGRLSKKKPRLITNFKKVNTGVNGGVTVLGFLGAFLVSIITFIYFYYLFDINIKIAIIISAIGLLGTIIDSYIGALWENKGYIDNAQTNFLATAISGIIAIIILAVI